MALGLQQIVDFSTHVKGNTLDLIISGIESEYKVSDVKCGPLLANHFLVSAVINFPKPQITLKEITYHKLKGIDMDQMIMDMHLDDLKEFRTGNVNNLLKEFEDHIINAVDIHTPSKTIRVPVHDKSPWYDQILRDQKMRMRKWEQIWRKYRPDHQLKAYQVERAKFNRQLRN